MCRYVVLLKFTERGVAEIRESVDRAAAFREAASKAGAAIDSQFWTIGPYDGLLVLRAPDEATAAALVLGLSREANVSTCMLRAFDSEEFKGVVAKM